MHASMRACMRACVRTCVRACVCVWSFCFGGFFWGGGVGFAFFFFLFCSCFCFVLGLLGVFFYLLNNSSVFDGNMCPCYTCSL